MKIFDEATVEGRLFAILVDEKSRRAYEAVWDGERWETDFSYFAFGIGSADVAELLDFAGVREAGYRFEGTNGLCA